MTFQHDENKKAVEKLAISSYCIFEGLLLHLLHLVSYFMDLWLFLFSTLVVSMLEWENDETCMDNENKRSLSKILSNHFVNFRKNI